MQTPSTAPQPSRKPVDPEFIEFHKENWGVLRGYLQAKEPRLVNDVEDLCNRSFLVMHAKWSSIAPPARRAFLYQVARNQVNDMVKRLKSRPEFADGLMVIDVTQKHVQQGPEHEYDMKEGARSYLEKFSPRQREALFLTKISDFSYEEAGKIMGVSAETVKSHLNSARASKRPKRG
ncbi:RNA polymerase sigma factor [Nocardiopsis flavescens]